MDNTPQPDDSIDAALQAAFSNQQTTALHLIEHVNGFKSQVELQPDQVLFRMGEAGDALYIVTHGSLRVMRLTRGSQKRVPRCWNR